MAMTKLPAALAAAALLALAAGLTAQTPAPAAAPGDAVRLEGELSFIHSGLTPHFGAAASGRASLPLWAAGEARGRLETGIDLAWQNNRAENTWHFDQGSTSASAFLTDDHKLSAAASLGHSLWFDPKGDLVLSLSLDAGALLGLLDTRLQSDSSSYGLAAGREASLRDAQWVPLAGLRLGFRWYFSDCVGVSVGLGGHLPFEPNVAPVYTVGLGLALRSAPL